MVLLQRSLACNYSLFLVEFRGRVLSRVFRVFVGELLGVQKLRNRFNLLLALRPRRTQIPYFSQRLPTSDLGFLRRRWRWTSLLGRPENLPSTGMYLSPPDGFELSLQICNSFALHFFYFHPGRWQHARAIIFTPCGHWNVRLDSNKARDKERIFKERNICMTLLHGRWTKKKKHESPFEMQIDLKAKLARQEFKNRCLTRT